MAHEDGTAVVRIIYVAGPDLRVVRMIRVMAKVMYLFMVRSA